jgi:hypothetical protein
LLRSRPAGGQRARIAVDPGDNRATARQGSGEHAITAARVEDASTYRRSNELQDQVFFETVGDLS